MAISISISRKIRQRTLVGVEATVTSIGRVEFVVMSVFRFLAPEGIAPKETSSSSRRKARIRATRPPGAAPKVLADSARAASQEQLVPRLLVLLRALAPAAKAMRSRHLIPGRAPDPRDRDPGRDRGSSRLRFVQRGRDRGGPPRRLQSASMGLPRGRNASRQGL